MLRLAKQTNPDNNKILNAEKTEKLFNQLYNLLSDKLNQSEEEMLAHKDSDHSHNVNETLQMDEIKIESLHNEQLEEGLQLSGRRSGKVISVVDDDFSSGVKIPMDMMKGMKKSILSVGTE